MRIEINPYLSLNFSYVKQENQLKVDSNEVKPALIQIFLN